MALDFMSEFRPRPETTQLFDGMALALQDLDQRLKANNAYRALGQTLVPLLATMQQWVMSQGQDLADYAQAVAARIEPGDGGGLDEEELALLEAVHEHLGEVQKLFDEYKAILPENVVKLGEHNKELIEGLEEMLASDEDEEDEEGSEEESEDDGLFADDTSPETPSAKESKFEVTDE